ncbi:hypothetical protein [Ruegeria meonggei]|uniref:Uncharacterized protein n=1 Tax=Ruegeria meonggei TaxID=1446476 RepID=A0A1X6ZIG2_9RHOB|nr:hypothetical protein [Ruegeria meonggei]SLN52067.1 hypothetical protein RUM8411_02512 [Ruegeria meonggei]
MDLSYVIVGVIALGVGVAIGQRRKRSGADSVYGTQTPATHQTGMDQDKSEGDMSPGMRVFMTVFLGGWLIAWSAGILMAFSTFLSLGGGGSLFVGGWLIAATAGWGWAVYTLWKLVTGRPVNLRRWH